MKVNVNYRLISLSKLQHFLTVLDSVIITVMEVVTKFINYFLILNIENSESVTWVLFFLIYLFSSSNDYHNFVSEEFRGRWAKYQSSWTWSISLLISIKQHYRRRNFLANCQVLPLRKEAVFTRRQRLSNARITKENGVDGAYNKNSPMRIYCLFFFSFLSLW